MTLDKMSAAFISHQLRKFFRLPSIHSAKQVKRLFVNWISRRNFFFQNFFFSLMQPTQQEFVLKSGLQ